MTVTTFAQLQQYAESAETLVIQVSGTLSAPGEHGLIRIQSNKTIIGLGGNAVLNKVTLSVNGFRAGETCNVEDYGSFTPASHVIIRHLECTGLAEFPAAAWLIVWATWV